MWTVALYSHFCPLMLWFWVCRCTALKMWATSFSAHFPFENFILDIKWLYMFLQSTFDFVLFFIDIVCIVCALLWCGFYCYFGNMASDRLSSLGDTAFATDWYNYPVEWQKFVILIALRSGKPVYFKGLNVITCTLEVFGKVSRVLFCSLFYFPSWIFFLISIFSFKIFKSACSYYIIFRSFSQIWRSQCNNFELQKNNALMLDIRLN